MRTRRLGLSDIECPVIVLGAWAIGGWAWGPQDDLESIRAIQAAVECGLTAVDTAPAYGQGRSERVVGEAIRGRRHRVLVMTKCGLRWDDDRGEHFFDMEIDGVRRPIHRNLRPDSVRLECERSLQRLGVETIDLYQCHWPDPTTPVAETMGEMGRLHREGKIRAVGVSNFTVEMLEEARGALGSVPLASEQPKYSLLARDIEESVLPYARETDLGILAYSPLAQGLLTGRVDPGREFPPGDDRAGHPLFSAPNRVRINDALGEIRPLAERMGLTLAQLILAWTVHQPGVTAAIAGARTPDQALENARAGSVVLEARDLEAIEAAFGNLELDRG